MRAAICAAIVLAGVVGGTPGQEKKKATRYQVTAAELAAEFAADPEAAAKKYAARDGALITVSGMMRFAYDRNVYLETGSRVGVLLKARRFVNSTLGRRLVEATARLRVYKSGTVVLDCNEARLTLVVGWPG